MTIRIVAAVSVLLLVIFSSFNNGSAKTSNSPTPRPIATPNLVVSATETAVVPQTGLSTRTVEATPAATATVTRTIESVPTVGKEEEKASGAPNLPSSAHPTEVGPNEVSGAHLTIYSCIGDSGGYYCPELSRSASGEKVAPGVAACDPQFMGMKFVIDSDPTNTVWTCLDTGLFTKPLFDLWFYEMQVGLDYLNNIPDPYKVIFVD